MIFLKGTSNLGLIRMMLAGSATYVLALCPSGTLFAQNMGLKQRPLGAGRNLPQPSSALLWLERG